MEVLYSDSSFLVINKAAGLLSIQDGYNPDAPHVRTIIEPEFGKCWIVHRLDKETSGAMLLARSIESHRELSILFENRLVSKEYRCVVLGIPSTKHFTIDAPLRINGDRSHRTVVDYKKGKNSQTEIDINGTYLKFAYISAKPRTGYTHQIRAHLSHIGHPIIGDVLYWHSSSGKNNVDTLPIKRLALHSYSISFIHPFSSSLFSISAPFPPDLVEVFSNFN